MTLLIWVGVYNLTFSQWKGGSLSTENIYREGNIGIGTSTAPPGFATFFLSRSLNPQIMFQESAGAVNEKFWTVLTSGGSFRVITVPDDYISSAPVDAIKINRSGMNITNVTFPNGNVGIGTSIPDQKLTVKGKIHALEVNVDINVPGPDYVFDKSYKLPALHEVESYIRQNKHLPEVPSASEIKENGIMVGENSMLLLKKIEELTLYVIELKKENEQQQKAIEELRKANKK